LKIYDDDYNVQWKNERMHGSRVLYAINDEKDDVEPREREKANKQEKNSMWRGDDDDR
jgi:hypothetical protein